MKSASAVTQILKREGPSRMTEAAANEGWGSTESGSTTAGQQRPVSAETLPAGFATERDYADWLRAELDRLRERSYKRIFFLNLESYEFIFGPWANQGRMFAIDLLNALKSELLVLPTGSHLTLLDVGAGCGARTALLASFFSKPWYGFTIDCEALEPAAPHWAEIYPVLYGNLRLRLERLCDIADGSYDIVTASHVIEHIARQEVAAFIRKLASVARRLPIVICPWKERPPLCPGHMFSVDYDLIEEVEPDSFTIFRSLGWKNPIAGPAPECVAMLFRSK